jgi:hypothetical protein
LAAQQRLGAGLFANVAELLLVVKLRVEPVDRIAHDGQHLRVGRVVVDLARNGGVVAVKRRRLTEVAVRPFEGKVRVVIGQLLGGRSPK